MYIPMETFLTTIENESLVQQSKSRANDYSFEMPKQPKCCNCPTQCHLSETLPNCISQS